MNKYDILKSINLSEKNISLSLTRGEVRADIDDKFTPPYIQWHCDENFLAIHQEGKDEDLPEDFPVEETEDFPVEETEDFPVEETEDFPVEETEDFPDFDSMNTKQVKAYANTHKVDISGLSKKSDIIDAIVDELSEEEE